MGIELFIRCSSVAASIDFYTSILDFSVVVPPDPDPASFMSKYGQLERQGGTIHLSAHKGDGQFGNTIYVRVSGVEDLYRNFCGNGLSAATSTESPGVIIPLTLQTWGMKEFTVRDPDGNRITFGQPSD